MKKHFKPLIDEKTKLLSNETMAIELDVSVLDGFFKGEEDVW